MPCRKSWLAACLILALAVGCSPKQTHNNPPVKAYASSLEALKAVDGFIQNPRYQWAVIGNTGSMKPFFQGGEWVILDTKFPLEALIVDDLIAYDAVWNKSGKPICHRVNYVYPDSLIVSGDANSVYEKGNWRVTKENYRGKIVMVIKHP